MPTPCPPIQHQSVFRSECEGMGKVARSTLDGGHMIFNRCSQFLLDPENRSDRLTGLTGCLCLLFIPSGAETLAFGAASQNRPLPVFRLDFRRQQSVTVTGCGDGQIPPHSLQALPARSRTSVWPGSGRWKHPQAADACQLKGTSPPPTVDGVSVCSLSAALTQEYDTAFKDGGTAVSRKRDLDAQ